ncbi:MAG: FHA domain-containing protein [Chthoniobacterales bacterium]
MRLTVYFPEDSPTTHEFVGAKLSIGRLGDNDVQLEEGSVSSRHAEIAVEDGQVILRDLGSTNGTFLNGEQVTGEHPLNEGDEIYFGGVRSVFMEPIGAAAEPAAAIAVEATGIAAEATGTGVPANFRPLSPFPPAEKKRDTLALAAWASFGLGVAAALYALFLIFTF